jgi:uncharacterized membrane protein
MALRVIAMTWAMIWILLQNDMLRRLRPILKNKQQVMTQPTSDSNGQISSHEHHSLSKVLEHNIWTILRLRLRASKERHFADRIADAITDFSGHLTFVYIHIIWFSAWILLNSNQFGIKPFDPFPYGFLTMVVSLEAIFLSTFVLISQNRLNQESENRANLSLQIGLLTEHEVTRCLQMLDAIQDKLSIENHEDSTLADLEMETKPEDVLAEIDRLQKLVNRHRK